MLLPCHQNAGQNHDIKIANRSSENVADIKIANRSSENVAQFKYLRTTVTNRNFIHEESKRGLNSGNVCYHFLFLSAV
jgi:hypothetical protein